MSFAARTEPARMKKPIIELVLLLFSFALGFAPSGAQEKKLERIRIGGGSVGAPQMTMWFAKEANLYEKHGLAVEAISIPGSSMPLQAMLSGEVPIIQLGGTASTLANFAGADTVIVATIIKKFVFSIFSRPEIARFADLKGKLFGATRFGTLSDFASRFALERNGLNPDRDVAMVQTGGQPETLLALLPEKFRARHFRFRRSYARRRPICGNSWIWPNWKPPSIKTVSSRRENTSKPMKTPCGAS